MSKLSCLSFDSVVGSCCWLCATGWIRRMDGRTYLCSYGKARPVFSIVAPNTYANHFTLFISPIWRAWCWTYLWEGIGIWAEIIIVLLRVDKYLVFFVFLDHTERSSGWSSPRLGMHFMVSQDNLKGWFGYYVNVRVLVSMLIIPGWCDGMWWWWTSWGMSGR